MVTLAFTAVCADAQTSTYDFVEDGTRTILAKLAVSGNAPFGHGDILSLAFTEEGSTKLTDRLYAEIPSLADAGFVIPPGQYPAVFDLTSANGNVVEKGVEIGPSASGLMGSAGNFASIYANVFLPPRRTTTLRLNFGFPGSLAPIDQIQFIPTGAEGAAVFGEWTLVPEPSSAYLLLSTIILLCFRRGLYPKARRVTGRRDATRFR